MLDGRRPTPTNLKVLRGNPRKENLKEKIANEPKPTISDKVPRPSRLLKGDKEAKKEWRRLAPQLHKLGLLTDMDISAFEQYCMIYGRWVRANMELMEQGNIAINEKGTVKRNPIVEIVNKLDVEVRQQQARFGLDPSSRTRVKAEAKQEEDPFESFMRKAK